MPVSTVVAPSRVRWVTRTLWPARTARRSRASLGGMVSAIRCPPPGWRRWRLWRGLRRAASHGGRGCCPWPGRCWRAGRRGFPATALESVGWSRLLLPCGDEGPFEVHIVDGFALFTQVVREAVRLFGGGLDLRLVQLDRPQRGELRVAVGDHPRHPRRRQRIRRRPMRVLLGEGHAVVSSDVDEFA